jgi:hypothetical protein
MLRNQAFENARGTLLSCYDTAVGLGASGGGLGGGFGLGGGLGDDVGLMNGALDDLLLFGIEVLGKVLVERRLFLLQSWEWSVC